MDMKIGRNELQIELNEFNKLASVFHGCILVLIMNFVITLRSK